jgi:hypothetical protein
MFRECTEEVQRHLIELSCKGFIYIGRTGAGLTNDFRKSTFQHGTIKAIDTERNFIGEVKAKLLQLIAIEGPRWVGFQRIENEYYGVKYPQLLEQTQKNMEDEPT